MKKLLCTIAVVMGTLYIPNSYAIDQTKDIFNITTRAFGRSLDFTSDTTTSTRDKFKLVQAAKSDAATFVATEGKVQGPYLTKAFEIIRDEYPTAVNLPDLELAKAVLAIK